MFTRHQLRFGVVLVSLVSIGNYTSNLRAAPAAKSTVHQAKALARAEARVIDAAIVELKKEYAASAKDPDGNALRTQCNYFVDHPVQLSPEALLDALEQPQGDDPRGVAYVKWQLLSAAPEKFDPKFLPRVLAVYARAPVPPARFGSSAQDRGKLDVLLLKSRKEDDALISTQVEERVRAEAEANRPILAYRDALYGRLPEGFDTIVAGLRDAHDRTLAAAGGGASDHHAARVVKDALAWAQSGSADVEQCGKLAELVARLRFVRSRPYYARVAWRSDRLVWSTRTDSVYSAKKLADLENVLRAAHKLGKAQQASQQSRPRTARQAIGKRR